MPIDFEVGGVYLPPIAQALQQPQQGKQQRHGQQQRLGVMQRVWHPALFEGALYTCICALIILFMGS